MSITDKLREYALGWDERNRVRHDLIAIADRIDAEHERECKEQYACGAEHGIGASIETSMIQTHGYVELPKDADNVPWNIGDRDEDGNVVIELRLTSSSWFVITDNMGPYRPERIRHYHEPTVEDILTKMLEQAVGYSDAHTTVALDTIAEYAAKLQLKEN